MQHSSIADELTHEQLRGEFKLLVDDRDHLLARLAKHDIDRASLQAMFLKLVSNHAELRWRHKGMEGYCCTSCGAVAHTDHNGKIQREESCSRSCPWKMIEDFYGIA